MVLGVRQNYISSMGSRLFYKFYRNAHYRNGGYDNTGLQIKPMIHVINP